MRAGLLRLSAVFLLTGMMAASAQAQIEALVPGFPLSTGLAPSLTDDPQTAPVTTLATDLLAPQRPYIFDPSGASVVSNALNPAIYASSFSGSLVKTDTQIRDSSQAGHLNPYLASAQRLGLSFSGGDASESQVNRNTSNGSFRGAPTGEAGNEWSASRDTYQSSWGTSSSFGSQSEESSWGTHRLDSTRLGNRYPNSLAATRGTQGGPLPTGDSNDNRVGSGGGYLTAGDRSSFARSSIGGSMGKSPNSLGSRYRDSSTNSAGYGSRNSLAPGVDSENELDQFPSTQMAGSIPGSAMNGASRTKAQSAQHTLNFFPQAAYNPSVLGQTPFSSPFGVEELHFLNPDIYAATSQGGSPSFGEKGSAAADSLRQAFVRRDHIPANASHYGLNMHPEIDRPARINSDKSELEKRSHLSTGLLDSDIP
jgi:hypothetical protein